MRILVTNVFGVRNKGDQALLKSLFTTLREIDPSVEIIALSGAAAECQASFATETFLEIPWSVKNVWGWKRRALLIYKGLRFVLLECFLRVACSPMSRALRDADLVISCPGGFLEDSSWSYIANIVQLAAAKLVWRKCVVMAPQSIGPIESRFWVGVLGRLLRKLDRIYVRDEYSFRFCKDKLELKSRMLCKVPDLVLTDRSLRRFKTVSDSIKVVGITVVGWGFYGNNLARRRYLEALRCMADDLLRSGVRVLIIPQTMDMGQITDGGMAREALTGLAVEYLPQPNTLDAFLSYFDCIDLLIGSRLHSCLLALARGVPVISISYLPKCEEILGEIGLSEYVVDINTGDWDELKNLYNSLLSAKSRLACLNQYQSYVSGVGHRFAMDLTEIMCKN